MLVLGAALGVLGAWLLWGREAAAPERLHVDAGQLGALVWEGVDPSPSAPPECRALGATDIGPWRCSIHYAGGTTPNWAPMQRAKTGPPRTETVHLSVARNGSFRGSTNAGLPISGCCVKIHP